MRRTDEAVRARAALTGAVLTLTAVLAPGSAAAASAVAASAAGALSAVQQAVDSSAAAAAGAGIEQSVAVVDRATGETLADSGGATQYISESIVKLFTVAYYEHRAGGRPTGRRPAPCAR